MRKLLGLLLLTVLPTMAFAQQQGRHFCVAPPGPPLFGDDSNDGFYDPTLQTPCQRPWATLRRATQPMQGETPVVVAGDTGHVMPGTYDEKVYTESAGTPNARIRFLSETKWGAKLVGPSVSPNDPCRPTACSVFDIRADYVTIEGFDVTEAAPAAKGHYANGIHHGAVQGPHVIGNFVHDLAVPCSSAGGAGINIGQEIIVPDALVSGNKVNKIGAPNNEYCSYVHGIYFHPYRGTVQNNIVSNATGAGIVFVDGSHTVSNNLSFRNRASGIVFAGRTRPEECTTELVHDNIVTNNISMNSEFNYGIWESSCIGPGNRYHNNQVLGNAKGGLVLCDKSKTVCPVIPSEVLQTGSANPQFVDYRDDGLGDYHLTTGSVCIDSGTDLGAPDFDFDGVPRPPGLRDRGPYEYPAVSP